MKSDLRTVLGFLAASVVPAAYLAIAFPLSGSRDPASVFGSFVVAYYFSALATGFLGLPSFLLLSKFDLVTWWSSVACGAAAGVVALAVVAGGLENAVALMYAAIGAGAGLVFWIVWRQGRTQPVSSNVA
jgi:hypothetical protein